MSLTSENEMIKLKNWAVLEKDRGLFGKKDSGKTATFWITREQEESYIMEYSFETLPQFEKLCKDILKERMGERVQRIVSVSAYKNMPQGEIDDKWQEILPEYRYTF